MDGETSPPLALRWLHGAQPRRPAAPPRHPDARRVARPRRAAQGRHERRDRGAARHQHQHGQVPHLEHAREAGAARPPRARRLAPRRGATPPGRRVGRAGGRVVGGAAAGVGRGGRGDAGRGGCGGCRARGPRGDRRRRRQLADYRRATDREAHSRRRARRRDVLPLGRPDLPRRRVRGCAGGLRRGRRYPGVGAARAGRGRALSR